MPPIPCISQFKDLICSGIDHGANHCFCGTKWVQDTNHKLIRLGLQIIWLDRTEGTMASADSDAARTIGRIRVRLMFQDVPGDHVDSGYLDMTVLSNPNAPCLLGLATMFKFGFHVQLNPDPCSVS